MSSVDFHPAVTAWFQRQFGKATPAQARAWPAIRQHRHTLIAAPTGSGKTLAAFLAAIDELVREGLAQALPDETRVLYISPLKALSNDVHKNLELPLAGIRDELLIQHYPDVAIRAAVRSGDTPTLERARMRRQAPHILVTTPESLFILLSSESGRRMLKTVRSVIVDEIHAMAGNKRGAHLSLSLERLAALCYDHQARTPTRIGLSATQKPIEDMARFLIGVEANGRGGDTTFPPPLTEEHDIDTGASSALVSRNQGGRVDCAIIDTGHARDRDIAIEMPASPLEAVMANEVWEEIYERLQVLIQNHRTTLIFVNTRRLAERAARHLAERLGEEAVTAHHGSLSREHRLDAEQRLKAGTLRALVATASLELGIDIGDVDLVCQLGSPRAISVFLQRVGRAGHAVHAIPKGRLFPLSQDELVECTALLAAVQRGELDRILIPAQPLDVLAQQIVAEVASREWDEQALYQQLRRAWPYRALTLGEYTAVVRMLADGYSTRRGRRGAYLHRDTVNGRLRARRGARLTAMTNGGAIPDLFDYDVILQPEGLFIGSLNEDFAFESMPGDIFQLGNTSYRVLKLEQGKMHVADAHGQPPNLPFWLGEAPGRSDELSLAVSQLRADMDEKLHEGVDAAVAWLRDSLSLDTVAAQQLSQYLATAQAALGVLPTQETVVLERFFDETGDMHLVIHSSFGSRINRAWGLALRKRFCRKFNFELQAAALEDSIVLSLGPTHSFPLDEVCAYLKSASVRAVLIQALLDAPLFETRWRWNCNIALAVLRNRNGKRIPAQWQRTGAQDLVALIFPDQLACLENIAGDRAIPDHPLVQQTIHDCLYEAMDIEGLEQVLTRLEAGLIRVETRDLAAPSPLAQAILSARPYAFLDDAPAEERRTLAVQQRRYLDPQSAADLGRLNPEAIAQVRVEAWPEARDADELHDALNIMGFITAAEAQRTPHWSTWMEALCAQNRATVVTRPHAEPLWVAAERLAEMLALFPEARLAPVISAVDANTDRRWTADEALRELLRSRLEGLGPVTAPQLAAPLAVAPSTITLTLAALEQEGQVLQGRFTAATAETEWCERGLLARIHRYTVQQLRREIEPVSASDFMRFLLRWQHVGQARVEGIEALAAVLLQLEGYTIPAAAWETEVLPARVEMYLSSMLDSLCGAGRFTWLRPQAPKDKGGDKRKTAPVRMTPITLLPRPYSHFWRSADKDTDTHPLPATVQKVAECLQQNGASFFIDIVQASGMLRTQVEEALGDLAARGCVSSDNFAGLRALIAPALRKQTYGRHSRRRGMVNIDAAGRWELLRPLPHVTAELSRKSDEERITHIAQALLRRYGVVFRKVLERENRLPPWRELLYVYRRMEARGELRGGRFVQGFSGEQFALPEAVSGLRDSRKRPPSNELIVISAADPLNLVGIITPGSRVAAQAGNRIALRDGVPLAALIAGEVHTLHNLSSEAGWRLRDMLLKKSTRHAAHSWAL